MPRVQKEGLEYFPLDVTFTSDLKIRKVVHTCGAEAGIILIDLLSTIYGDKGYYMAIDEDSCFFIAEKLSVTEEKVKATIHRAVEVELFDKDKLINFSILTSKGIQSRFCEATIRRKNVDLIGDFLMVNVEKYKHINIVENPLTCTKVQLNCTKVQLNCTEVQQTESEMYQSTQSKVKESKVKESKVKESKDNISCSTEQKTSVERQLKNKIDNTGINVFEECWKIYPKKRGKSSVSKSKQLEIQKVGLNLMIEATKRYADEVKGKEEQYILNGSTFFNGRYTDYLDENYTPLPQVSNNQTKTKTTTFNGYEQRDEDYDAIEQKALEMRLKKNGRN